MQPSQTVPLHLSDLLPQHGGAGVDHKHHILGHGGEVFGGEVVDKVAVQNLGKKDVQQAVRSFAEAVCENSVVLREGLGSGAAVVAGNQRNT